MLENLYIPHVPSNVGITEFSFRLQTQATAIESGRAGLVCYALQSNKQTKTNCSNVEMRTTHLLPEFITQNLNMGGSFASFAQIFMRWRDGSSHSISRSNSRITHTPLCPQTRNNITNVCQVLGMEGRQRDWE